MTNPCQHCGYQIGGRAKWCPSCGGKIDKPFRAFLWLVLFLLFLLATTKC
jgi:hypothetical protein